MELPAATSWAKFLLLIILSIFAFGIYRSMCSWNSNFCFLGPELSIVQKEEPQEYRDAKQNILQLWNYLMRPNSLLSSHPFASKSVAPSTFRADASQMVQLIVILARHTDEEMRADVQKLSAHVDTYRANMEATAEEYVTSLATTKSFLLSVRDFAQQAKFAYADGHLPDAAARAEFMFIEAEDLILALTRLKDTLRHRRSDT